MTKKQCITGLLVAISTIAPLLIVPFSADYFYLPKIVFVYVCVVGMLLCQFHDGKKPALEVDSPEKPLMVYLFLICIATILSVDPILSLLGYPRRQEGFFALLAYILLFTMANRHYKFSLKHVQLLLLSSLAVAGYGICQYFGLDPIPRDFIREGWSKRAFSTMGNPDFLGSYLTLILPLVSYAYLQTRRGLYLAASGLIYLALLCTMTRSSWLGAGVSTILLLIWAVLRKFSRKGIVCFVLLLILITLFMNQFSGGRVVGRFFTIGRDFSALISQEDNYEALGAGRIRIWQRVLCLIRQRPLLGYGLENLITVVVDPRFGEVGDNYSSLVRFDKAHNEYLHIAVTTGIPALLAYLWFLVVVLRRALKNINKNTLLFPLFLSIVGYLIQAFFNISVVSVAYLFWIFLGVLSGMARERGEVPL